MLRWHEFIISLHSPFEPAKIPQQQICITNYQWLLETAFLETIHGETRVSRAGLSFSFDLSFGIENATFGRAPTKDATFASGESHKKKNTWAELRWWGTVFQDHRTLSGHCHIHLEPLGGSTRKYVEEIHLCVEMHDTQVTTSSPQT